jgi:sugar phosphate isomerase/epimerase
MDIGHQSVFGKAPLSDWIENLAPWIRHLHLHDNHGDFDAHLPLGAGSIDLEPLSALLAACDPFPVITLEPHRQEDLLESIRYLDKHNILSQNSLS